MWITEICVDKTLWSLNVLNWNERTDAAQRNRLPLRVCCAAWACSFEFKILRVIRVYQHKLWQLQQTAYISAHNVFAIVIQFLTSFRTIYGICWAYFNGFWLSSNYQVTIFIHPNVQKMLKFMWNQCRPHVEFSYFYLPACYHIFYILACYRIFLFSDILSYFLYIGVMMFRTAHCGRADTLALNRRIN